MPRKPQQQSLKLGRLSSQQFSPVQTAQRGAGAFSASQGRSYTPPDPGLHQDPQAGFYIGQEFSSHVGAPVSPRLRKSYDAMRSEVGQQYDYMTRPKEKGGLGVQHSVVPQDPYHSAGAMASDVRRGKLRTLATATTGPHGYMSDTENDQFRAVHDFFGHAATGRGFSRHGEEAAWRSHVQMFSPQAREAMTSETRGQNSWMNYSSRGAGFLGQDQAMTPMSPAAQSPQLSGLLKRGVRRALSSRPRQPQGEQLSLPGFSPKGSS